MKKNNLNFFLLLAFILFAGKLHSQNSDSVVTAAKVLRNQKKYLEAEKLLKEYHKSYPLDFNSTWLYAQTTYWNNNIDNAINLYEEAMELQPGNYYLKLDYSKILVDLGRFEKATPIIDSYLAYDKTSADASLLKAKILYWSGDYSEAENNLNVVFKKETGNQEAFTLYENIKYMKSPWLKINGSYFNDSQPLENVAPTIEAGKLFSSLSAMKVSLTPLVYQRSESSVNINWFQIENKSAFFDAAMELTLGAGLIKYPDVKTNFTGKIQVDKLVENVVTLSGIFERKPYLSTLSSIDTSIMESFAGVSVALNTKDSWTGRAAYETNIFYDDNSTYSFSSWVLSPKIKISDIDFRLGCGFNYSMSKENRFVSEKSLDSIMAEYVEGYQIKGVYKPYFTPQNHRVTSLISSLTFHPGKIFRAGLTVNYGVIAKTQTPYLYLDSNKEGVKFITRNYLDEDFSPLNVNFFMGLQASKNVSLGFNFDYSSTNFYIRRTAGLNLLINFY